MNRVPEQRYATAIERAYSYLPEPLRIRLARVDFLCGVGAPFVGFGSWEMPAEMAARGITYSNGCAYYISLESGARITRAHRKPTICLPGRASVNPGTIVHELGHALHDQLGLRPKVQPVTRYAQTNDHEAFAEAFAVWVTTLGPVDDSFGAWPKRRHELLTLALGTNEMFEQLALGSTRY